MPILILLARSSFLNLQTLYIIAGILAVIAGVLYSCMSMSKLWSLQRFNFTLVTDHWNCDYLTRILDLLLIRTRLRQSEFLRFTSIPLRCISMSLVEGN